MKFEFTVGRDFNFVPAFAEKFRVRVSGPRLSIPASMGHGFIKQIDIEPGFKSVLHHYTLKQSFHLKRMSSAEPNDLISIVFNSNEVPTDSTSDQFNALQFLKNNGSAIQISSSILGTETRFPPNTE